MKTKLSLFAIAIAFAVSAAAPSAHAGGNDLAVAKKVTDAMMVHLVHMANVLDKNMNTPDKAVADITAYFSDKRRVKQFTALAAQVKTLNLTAADKKILRGYAKGTKAGKRVEASFKAFMTKNPTAIQQLLGVFMKLQNVMPR